MTWQMVQTLSYYYSVCDTVSGFGEKVLYIS